MPCQSVPEVDPAATTPKSQSQPRTSSSSYSAPQAPALSTAGPITANSEQVLVPLGPRVTCQLSAVPSQETDQASLDGAGGGAGEMGGGGGMGVEAHGQGRVGRNLAGAEL